MENGFSIVNTLYHRRMGHELRPGERQGLRQWQATDPMNRRLVDRLDSQREPIPDWYADVKGFTGTRLHHMAVGALMLVMCGFFVVLICLVILNGH